MNPKQERFCQEYILDGNATQAAIRAGYSAKTAASQGERLLRGVEISRRVTAARMALIERTQLTQDEVITGLRAEANRMGEGSSHGARVTAWTQLGKHVGMFADKQTHEGEVVIRILRGAKAA